MIAKILRTQRTGRYTTPTNNGSNNKQRITTTHPL